MWMQGLILLVLLILSAFFSGIETALVSLSELKVRALKQQKKKGSEILAKLKENQRRLIITILLGNNVVNVGASAYSAVILTNMFGSVGVGIATGGMTLLILTFGEILPKTYFANHAEKMGLRFSRCIYVMQIVLFPIIILFEKLSERFSPNIRNNITEHEMKAMIEMGAEDLVLHEKQEELMQSVFDFDDTVAREIMTPRVDVFALEENSKIKDVKKEINKMGYSRIPLYKDEVDNITGYFHIIDLLNANENHSLKTISKKVLHVSSEKIIQELFIEMQKKRRHIAVVVDEFGGTAGIITMEDIMEELVGEIFDENDEEDHIIKKIKKNTWLVDGDCDIDEINKELGLDLDTDSNYASINGYLQHKLKDLPEEGEKVNLKKAILEIKKKNDRKIEKVLIKLK